MAHGVRRWGQLEGKEGMKVHFEMAIRWDKTQPGGDEGTFETRGGITLTKGKEGDKGKLR